MAYLDGLVVVRQVSTAAISRVSVRAPPERRFSVFFSRRAVVSCIFLFLFLLSPPPPGVSWFSVGRVELVGSFFFGRRALGFSMVHRVQPLLL